MITRTLRVAEIHCSKCENAIRTTLSRVPGVSVVVPSADTNDVKISFDDTKVSEDDLRSRLGEIGFEALM